MKKRLIFVIAGVSAFGSSLESLAQERLSNQSSVSQVKYRSGKEIRFDELLIQGQMKRAELSVVTGDSWETSDGLLRLRENFLDHASLDLSEEVQ